ncbi:MAG: hypothetical protein H6719_11090 [Sandaracinaceae bacterium]|nr:hypothetical protein [Sandaracinaceae bacterium]
MANPARRPVVEALRVALRERFGADVDLHRRLEGDSLPSGWSRVDRAIGGGLRPGESALVVGGAGSGTLALATSWAREMARRGEPVIALDAMGTSMPHAWLEPEDAKAPIWVVRTHGGEVWAALDIALRSGAFGLAVLLEPPPAPQGVGVRVSRVARDRGTRVVVTQWSAQAAPWSTTHRIGLSAGLVRWVDGPLGDVPRTRRVEVMVGERGERTALEIETGTRPDRLRPAPRAPDRRPPSGHGGRTRRTSGASGPRDGGEGPVDR